ncbi:hypothetical protein [Psychromonas algicola]|uniref:hypothetical protein n=1 Tax=Psychromonas algicola TaxID=2555642 RepID=UPI0010689138|nr:hypothetical protein [Psychromonas sp. RZ5]TEW49260.1 hypothetical protein E2R67_10860 [Psychromonas sp. RZ5]
MAKVWIFLFTALLSGCSMMDKDEIDDLQEMAELSNEYKDITLNCLVEMKLQKSKGWDSESCEVYKVIAKTDIQKYAYDIKITAAAFARYAKSEGVDQSNVRKGFKELFTIETNFNAIKELSKTIQLATKE